MYCPTCKDEFRPGFSRCGRCNVDLVSDLSQVGAAAEPEVEAMLPPVQMADYCGFLSLDDAREARDRLRPKRIRSEIVVRETLDNDWDAPASEEYWLRVDFARAREVHGILGDSAPAAPSDGRSGETFACSDCGRDVAVEESFCPGCGVRFED